MFNAEAEGRAALKSMADRRERLRIAGESVTGTTIKHEDLDRLCAAVTFRDLRFNDTLKAIRAGSDYAAARETVELVRSAMKIPASLRGWLGDAAKLREAGLC